ncbi:MAG: hypothetical protein D6834_03390 [Aquificota bacterium]|nr:MAG: hypothetical protein D6834_03390 [Aquificota bacterium]
MSTLKCPICGSENVSIWKNGLKYCKNCKYTWLKGVKNRHRGKVECPDCGSKDVRVKESKKVNKSGKYSKKVRRFYCKECGATWWEQSTRKIRPEERKEWIKWIRQEVKEGKDIKEIFNYIKNSFDEISDSTVFYLIRQAVGRVKKKPIEKKDIERAISLRKIGFEWSEIEKKIGYSYKSIYNKAKYVFKIPEFEEVLNAGSNKRKQN